MRTFRMKPAGETLGGAKTVDIVFLTKCTFKLHTLAGRATTTTRPWRTLPVGLKQKQKQEEGKKMISTLLSPCTSLHSCHRSWTPAAHCQF